eukprot:123762_1
MSSKQNGWDSFMQKSRKQQSKSKSKTPRTSSNDKKRKLNPNSTNKQSPAPKKRKISTISYIKCPMCNKDILSHLIDFHLEEHFIKQNTNTKHKKPSEKSSNTNNSNSNNTNSNSQPKTASKPIPKAKICPLFTSGALPSSMFTKSSRRNNNTIPSQTIIFYVGIITDNTDRHIKEWNIEWIDNTNEIKPFLERAKQMNYFITNVFIKEPNTNKRSTKIYLITNYPSLNKNMTLISNEYNFLYPSPNNYKFSPSLIKSLLQKCVRVSYEKSALKAAYLLLLKDNLTSLLRRLSIIVIEDVILMKDYILLIWLLLSESKSNINEKYYPNICWYNWIFTLIKKCAIYKVKDFINYELYPNENQYINLFTPLKYENENKTDNTLGIKQLLIRTMLIRASYGGMKCDVAMLRGYACIWYNRFFGQNKYYNKRLETLCIKNDIKKEIYNGSVNESEIEMKCMVNENNWLGFLDKLEERYSNGLCVEMRDILGICDGDLILSAVDFHCSNLLNVLCNKNNGKCYQIINEYLNKNNSVNLIKWRNNIEGLLKLVIWEFRSSSTNKIGLLMNEEKPVYLVELWEKIKPVVNDFSLRHYKSRTHR